MRKNPANPDVNLVSVEHGSARALAVTGVEGLRCGSNDLSEAAREGRQLK